MSCASILEKSDKAISQTRYDFYSIICTVCLIVLTLLQYILTSNFSVSSIRHDSILMIENSKEYCTVVFASALTHSLQSAASVTCKAIAGWQYCLPCAQHDNITLIHEHIPKVFQA